MGVSAGARARTGTLPCANPWYAIPARRPFGVGLAESPTFRTVRIDVAVRLAVEEAVTADRQGDWNAHFIINVSLPDNADVASRIAIRNNQLLGANTAPYTGDRATGRLRLLEAATRCV
jgi:hypothetical protein